MSLNHALFQHLIASSTLKQFTNSIYITVQKVLQAIGGWCWATALHDPWKH